MTNGQTETAAAQEPVDGRQWVAERLARADKQARWFLTEHPILSLACAVGIGYLAARLLRNTK